MITDRDTGAGVTIDLFHHQIHAGVAYLGALTGTVAANTTGNYIMVQTPATSTGEPETHLRLRVGVTGAGQLNIYENPGALTAAGSTKIITRNLNRNSANTTKVGLSYWSSTAIAATTGTLISGEYINANLLGGQFNPEIVLSSPATYLIAFANANGALTTNVNYQVYFYQGIPVN